MELARLRASPAEPAAVSCGGANASHWPVCLERGSKDAQSVQMGSAGSSHGLGS